MPGSDTSIEVALMPSQIRMPGGRTLGILILSGRWPEQTDKTSRFARNEHLTLLGSSDTIAANRVRWISRARIFWEDGPPRPSR